MSQNSIDYFATLGRKEGQLTCKHLLPIGADSDEQNLTVHPSEVWGDAITDIEVIYKDEGESVRDSTWELIELTIDKTSADCLLGVPALGSVFIAVQRRKHSNRIDHISDIAVVYMGENVPDGYVVIEKSVSGETFFDNGSSVPRTRLAVRRAEDNQSMLIKGMPLIDDICIINRSLHEFEPDDYVVIDRCLQSPKTWSGDSMILAYHKREALGLCDLQYESVTMGRFPKEDHNGLALPVDELPMFVFPHGLQLKYCKKQSFPLPDFFTFVFTDVHGRHLYTTCLRFYEVIPHDEIHAFFSTMYGDGDNIVFCNDDMDVFAPKVICVVSQFPFYRAMGRFLKQLYSLSLSRSFFPIEHFIASVVSQIPVPVAGGRPLYVVLDAALISHSSRSMQPIKFELPPRCFFPPMDLDFSGPMRCLSLDHILAIICLLLQEHKLIFLCASNALLTDVMETFRSLLFPLTWSTCFVTRLPDLLSGLLQAPGGFMIGLHVPASLDISSVDGKKNDDIFSKYGTDHVWTSSLQGGTYIVDLSEDNILFFDGKETELLVPGKISSILRVLPGGPLQKLQMKLAKIAKTFNLCPQNVGHAQFDSVFEFQSFDADTLPAGVLWSDFPTMEVRDGFLKFMTDVLGDYSRYIISSPFISTSEFRTFKELFAVEDYQRDADKSVRVLLDHLIETQMFVNLIQERQEVPSYHLLFFDKAVKRLKDLNLSSLPSDNRHNPKYRQQNVSVPGYKFDASTPLYEHVIIMDARDACFSLPSDVLSSNTTSIADLKSRRDEFLGSVTNFEHALSHDDRSDSHDMTVEKSTDRQELVGQFDLHLDDFTKGPLIIPGPLLKERNIDRDGDTPTDQEYIYDTIWPIFDHNITDEVTNDTVRSELKKLRDRRKQVSEKSDAICNLFIREDVERNCYKINNRLLNAFRVPIHYDAKDAVLLTNFSDECKAAIMMTVGVFNVSMVLLSTRALHASSSSRDIVQALSILSHLDSMNLLNQVDETTWRSLIIAATTIEAGYFKDNLIRLLQASMQTAGVVPNVLTSTQRSAISSVARGIESPSETVSDPLSASVLDSFCHLEELGLVWFAHKILPFETVSGSPTLSIETPSSYYDPGPKTFQMSPPPPSLSSSVTPSPMRRFSNIFRKNSAEQHIIRKVQRKSIKALGAAVESANFMLLTKKMSYFSMQRPPESVVLFTVPQTIPPSISIERAADTTLASDMKSKVYAMREIFNKIQKLKKLELCSHGAEQSAKSVVSHVDNSSLAGVVVLVLRGASCLDVCNTGGNVLKRTTIYSRLWTTMAPDTVVKGAPGVGAFSTDQKASTDVVNGESVKLNIQNVWKDEVNVDLCGDFTDDGSEKCHIFDTCLGKGLFSVGAVLESGNPNIDVQLFSLSGEKTAVVHFTVDFTTFDRSAGGDDSCRISSQKSLESFFHTNNSSSVENSSKKLSRPASLGGSTPTAVSNPQIEKKKTWKERLSFGLYKDNAEVPCSSPTHTRRSMTPPPSLGKIEEGDDSCKGLSDIKLKIDMTESVEARNGDTRDAVVLAGGGDEEVPTSSVSTSTTTEETSSIDGSGEPVSALRAEIKTAQDRITNRIKESDKVTRNLIKHQKRSIGIYSCTPCAVCGFCMTDDEMMAEWAGFPSVATGASKPKREGEGRQSKHGIMEAHVIVCVMCHADVVPLLHVQQYEHSNADGVSRLILLEETSVPYISPFGVRFKMEAVIAENGTDILNSSWLLETFPYLYWNMLWYSTRLDLPSGLSPPHSWLTSESSQKIKTSEHLFFGPVEVSWRECVVRAKLERVLEGEQLEIDIKDVFPGASESDLEAAGNIASTMDTTPTGFSAAFMECAKLKSLPTCFHDSPARGLYLTFLMLAQYASITRAVNFQSRNLYLDLPKGTLFDQMYKECLDVTLTPLDFEHIDIERKNLVEATSSTCALNIRILFGLML